MAEHELEIYGGVDSHLDNHVAAVVDSTGRIRGVESFPADSVGYRALHRWMRRQGRLVRVGVEGTGAYGAGLARHTEADALFEQQFVTAPAIRFGGLGPLFNQNACQSCHIRNGRSQPPVSPSDQASGLLIRLSVPGAGEHGGPAPVPGFGGQFQPKAIFGGVPEGKLAWTEMQQIVQFLDGGTATLTRAEYRIEEPYQPLPQGGGRSDRARATRPG